MDVNSLIHALQGMIEDDPAVAAAMVTDAYFFTQCDIYREIDDNGDLVIVID